MSKAPPPIPPKPYLYNQTPPPAASTQLPSKSACSSSPIPPPFPSTSSNNSPLRLQASQVTQPPIIPPRPKPTLSSNVSSSSSLSSSPTRSMPPPPAAPASAEINSNEIAESRTSLVSVFSSLFGPSSSSSSTSPTKIQTAAVVTSPTPPLVPSRPAKSPSTSTNMPSHNNNTATSSVSELSAPPPLPPRILPKPNNISASNSNSDSNSRNTSRSNSPITKSSPIKPTIHATMAVISDSPPQQHDYEELYAGSEHVDDTFYSDDFTAAAASTANVNNSKESSGGKLKPMVTPVKVEKKNVNVLSTIALTAEYQKPATVDMIREGVLTKIDSHGNEVMYHFTLTNTMLVYTEFVNIGNPDKLRVYEVTKLMAFENEENYDDDPLSFRLLTKEKSWRMKCTTIKEKQDWFNDVVKIASEKQKAEPGIERVWREFDLAPLFELKCSVVACQLCQRGFKFMGIGAARHHCRNCGKVVCDLCSRERVRIERLDDKALMKVCSACARELKNTRKYGK